MNLHEIWFLKKHIFQKHGHKATCERISNTNKNCTETETKYTVYKKWQQTAESNTDTLLCTFRSEMLNIANIVTCQTLGEMPTPSSAGSSMQHAIRLGECCNGPDMRRHKGLYLVQAVPRTEKMSNFGNF
jgi:hypothetical protein